MLWSIWFQAWLGRRTCPDYFWVHGWKICGIRTWVLDGKLGFTKGIWSNLLKFFVWALQRQGFPQEYIRLLDVLYDSQSGFVDGSDSFPINRGVKQGDVLSPALFNAGLEDVMASWKQRLTDHGVDVGLAERLTNIRYADDIFTFCKKQRWSGLHARNTLGRTWQSWIATKFFQNQNFHYAWGQCSRRGSYQGRTRGSSEGHLRTQIPWQKIYKWSDQMTPNWVSTPCAFGLGQVQSVSICIDEQAYFGKAAFATIWCGCHPYNSFWARYNAADGSWFKSTGYRATPDATVCRWMGACARRTLERYNASYERTGASSFTIPSNHQLEKEVCKKIVLFCNEDLSNTRLAKKCDTVVPLG